jgi:hypothetical protein
MRRTSRRALSRAGGLRLVVALIGVVGAAAFTGVAAKPVHAIYFNPYWECYYCGPAWYTPGEQHVSAYDDGCQFWWDGNWFSKSTTALGTIAFIDTSGTWRASAKTYEHNMIYYVSPANWSKKLLSKDSSTVGYSANSYGEKVEANCL